ncbi:MAG: NFACT family protein [Bacillus subtilis]|nr:NFACT family protein [Bacillus subtilis]
MNGSAAHRRCSRPTSSDEFPQAILGDRPILPRGRRDTHHADTGRRNEDQVSITSTSSIQARRRNIRHYPDLLDDYYYDLSRQERMKQIGNNVARARQARTRKGRPTSSKNYARIAKPRCKLTNIAAHRGDLIKANQAAIAKGMTSVACRSTTNKTAKFQSISIRCLTPSENLQAAYKKYKKLKRRRWSHPNPDRTNARLISSISPNFPAQIELADQNDLVEIVDELAKQGYLKAKPTSKKPLKPHDRDLSRRCRKPVYFVGKNNHPKRDRDPQARRTRTTGGSMSKRCPAAMSSRIFLVRSTESVIRNAANLAVSPIERHVNRLPFPSITPRSATSRKFPARKGRSSPIRIKRRSTSIPIPR